MYFSSPLTLYKISLLLFACSFLLSYILTPLIRKFSLRFDILDKPTLERKIHKTPIPLFGGVAIFLGFLITLSFLYVITSYYISIGGEYYFDFKEKQLFWIKVGLYLICSFIILLIGILDDLKSIDFKPKLFVQILAAIIILFGGSNLNVFSSSFLNFSISFFWIVCLTNSFNLLDNMNGLSSGLSAIIIGLFIVLGFITKHYLLTVFLIIPFGCILGFLPYNFPKAKIFLGDSGSLFIGFSLAIYSMWIFQHLMEVMSSPWATVVCIICSMGIPIADTFTVIAIRLKNKKPIYIGDANHLSHQLVRLGFSASHAVLILYGSTLMLGLLGLAAILL